MKLEIVTNATNEKIEKEIEKIKQNCQVIHRGRNTLTVHLNICPQLNEKPVHHEKSFEFIGKYIEKFFPHSDRINVKGLFNENVTKIELK